MTGILAALFSRVFFFNDTATTDISTLSLHDALPISHRRAFAKRIERGRQLAGIFERLRIVERVTCRSEEHTSELQSQSNLVCRLLLEKKKDNDYARDGHSTPQAAPFRLLSVSHCR